LRTWWPPMVRWYRRAARIVIGVLLGTPPFVSDQTAPDEENGARVADAGAEADLARLDLLGEGQVGVAHLGVDAAGELLALHQRYQLEVVVVLHAAEVQVRRADDGEALVEGRHLQMREVVLILVHMDAGVEQFRVLVLHGVLRKLVVVPLQGRTDEVYASAAPRRRAELLDDSGMVDVGVLDEDRLLRPRDAFEEHFANLIRLVVGLVGVQRDRSDRSAARRSRPADRRRRPVVVSPVEDPALAKVGVEVARDRALEAD